MTDALMILLVEDNPADAAIVAAQLLTAGGPPVVRTAVTLAEAIAQVGAQRFDVILLDLSLPDSEGIDTLLSLHTRAPLTPVIVLSGREDPELWVDTVRLGAQDFLVKGRFTPQLLERSIQFAIARHRLMLQARQRGSTATIDIGDDHSTEPLEPLRPGLPRLPLTESNFEPPTTVTGRITAGDRTASTTSFFTLAGGLGSGGMSDVLLAHQINLDRDVAVKVLKPGHDRAQLARFQAEARVTAALEHPSIVPVYDLGETFFVMRRVQGTTLAKLINYRTGDDELGYFVEILLKVCDAIAFAHSHGVIHRDIKPENIMVGDYGQVLVLDWGLALSLRPGPDGRYLALPIPEDGREVCAGTLGFLPPEIATGRADKVGIGTDVFLLGATLYCVLTGESPYDGSNQYACLHASAATRYMPASERNPSAPAGLIDLQRRAMLIEPEQRGTVGDFARDLRGWLRGG